MRAIVLLQFKIGYKGADIKGCIADARVWIVGTK